MKESKCASRLPLYPARPNESPVAILGDVVVAGRFETNGGEETDEERKARLHANKMARR